MSAPKWLAWTIPKSKAERLKREAAAEQAAAQRALDEARALLLQAQAEGIGVRSMERDVRNAMRRNRISHKLEVAMRVVHK